MVIKTEEGFGKEDNVFKTQKLMDFLCYQNQLMLKEFIFVCVFRSFDYRSSIGGDY